MKKCTILFCLCFISTIIYSQSADVWIERADVAEEAGNLEAANICYQKVLELDSTDQYIFYSRANVLVDLGEKNKDKAMFKESFEMYRRASELGSSSVYVYNDWAVAVLRLAKMENNIRYYESEITTLCLKSEKLGDQVAAYNLACMYSLLNKKKKSLEWLEKALTNKYQIKSNRLTKSLIEKDPDFDNIRKDKKFEELLMKYAVTRKNSIFFEKKYI
ncbi:tetratricopeptide repeat protein [Dysgonomonas sp. HGC4]|uniref:tetratricopeptide repeat protein n=1 Tax=Dysgonomonas sp. HGC4 TaxID=1658009 RepID=UPI000682BDB4|nr:tetratricopeptide repeat protein [Dysgonomonas sp. HGC4]MBD8349395.1 hypothetical protein [Dysgonomonas sp. HGC4]